MRRPGPPGRGLRRPLGGVLRGPLADAVRHASRGGVVRIGVEREGETVVMTLRGDGLPPAPPISTDDGLDADGRLIPRLGFAAAQRLVEAIGGSLSSGGAALSLRLPAAGLGAAGQLAGAGVLVVGADLADLGLMRRVVTEKGGSHPAGGPAAGPRPRSRPAGPGSGPNAGARLALRARLDADPLLFGTPVVALTCAVSQAERGRIDAAGFAARLSRPLDSAALGDALGEVLSAICRPVPLDVDRPRGA